jgi:hypothetical protein
MENLWQDLPRRAACLFSQSANLTCDRQVALRSSFFYKGREEEELTAPWVLAWAGSETGFLLLGVCLPIAQLLLLRRSLWPGSASLPRLRSCLARPMPLARPRQIKKVSIKCDRNFRIVENLFSSQRSALGCASYKAKNCIKISGAICWQSISFMPGPENSA